MSQCQEVGRCNGSLIGNEPAAVLLTKASAEVVWPSPPPPSSQLCPKLFSSASVLGSGSTRYKILNGCPFCLFQPFEYLSHHLQASTVYVEKLAVYLTWVLLYTIVLPVFFFLLLFICSVGIGPRASCMLGKSSFTATHPLPLCLVLLLLLLDRVASTMFPIFCQYFCFSVSSCTSCS